MRLEPASEGHAAGLARHALPDTFRYFNVPTPTAATEEAVQETIRWAKTRPDVLMFSVLLQDSGEPVGMSSYMDIRPEHLALEVGMTWYGEGYRGAAVNPESKLLLLGHAFEVLGCERVQLKTDGRNLQSQRAIAKLGAKLEGVLRKHSQMPDGYMRDTVMFSVLREEWPAVKEGLLQRLGTFRPR